MQPDFWVPFLAQLPIVAGIFGLLQSGYLYIGRTINNERRVWQERLDEERARTKAAEDRLLMLAGTLKEATDATNRAVDLAEKVIDDRRNGSARTRADDR